MVEARNRADILSDRDDDVRTLIHSIHEDRVAAKEKEKKEGWTRYVSLMVVVLAVGTGIGSLKAGAYGSRVMLNQSKASDTWAFYQAKRIKQHLSEMEMRAATGEAAARFGAEIERYKSEEAKLKADAEAFEKARDEAALHGPPLGFAIATLQIAIALASVCLLTKKKPLWAASGVLGGLGLGYLVYGLYILA